MAVSLALLEGEFVLSGGHLKTSMIGTGLTTVGAKQFVTLKKGEHWLTWFTTGSGVQQSPLNGSRLFNTIRDQVRARIEKAIGEAKGAAVAPLTADLADELELGTVGIQPAMLKKKKRDCFDHQFEEYKVPPKCHNGTIGCGRCSEGLGGCVRCGKHGEC